MSNDSLARRTDVLVSINGADISEDMRGYLLSVSYTDEEEDKTDDINVQLDDRDGIWLKNWLNSSVTSRAASGGSGFSVGDNVMVKQGATDYNGTALQQWVYSYEGFTVIEVGVVNPDLIVFGIDGAVTAAIRADDLIKRGESSSVTSSGTRNGLIGATISVSILQRNPHDDGADRMLECGTFQVDTIAASGPPSKITLKGTSLPFTSTIRSQLRSRAWENVRLSVIAGQIARDNRMSVYFSSDYDPLYTRREQSQESDIVFLSRLCKAAGIALKVSANTIILFDEAAYEQKKAVRSLINGKSDIISYNFTDGASDTTYSSCHVSYTDSGGKTIEYTYTPRNSDGSGQVLEISEKVNDREEARQLAMKRLRQKNKNKFSAKFKLVGDVALVAGVTINVSGFGAFDGKYIIEQAVHSVSSSGYVTTVQARKVLEEY